MSKELDEPSFVDEDFPLRESTEQLELENERSDPSDVSLPFPLQILFSLNGATLALPSTALMYIVNTRASIPIVYLSIYGALAFLPNSFKPLYAYLSDFFPRRDKLLSALLFLSGASIAATALVPKGGITACFIVAILREIFSAWPELLLGITMLQDAQAKATDSGGSSGPITGTTSLTFDAIAARFQSQAATARNMGSWSATVVGFGFFLYRHYHVTKGTELNDFAVNLILVATGCVNVFGAIFAWYHGVGYRHCYARLESDIVPNSVDDDTLLSTTRESTNNCRLLYGDAVLIVLLQLLVVIFAMRSPLVAASSELVWNLLLLLLASAMIVTVGLNFDRWSRAHRVGFFLIARHAIPTSGFLMGSFVYELFQTTPMALQVFAVFSGGVTTLSSWSYGRFLAPYCSGTQIVAVIIGTTMLASVVSLLDMIVADLDRSDNQWKSFATIMTISAFTTFVDEWSFLPSIVLATTAVSVEEDQSKAATTENDSGNPEELVSYQHMRVSPCDCKAPTASIGMQYGALVSCLNFGDQIGSWLTMPLVAALGISRENDWEHMDTFIWTTALLSLIPLALLPIIRS
jgi:hypothetical protein